MKTMTEVLEEIRDERTRSDAKYGTVADRSFEEFLLMLPVYAQECASLFTHSSDLAPCRAQILKLANLAVAALQRCP